MSNSGTSTPRGALTPPPAAGDGPSPLAVGTRFVKAYYRALTTDAEKIFHFYQPSSVLSVGVGSQPTQPGVFDSLQGQLKDRFAQEGYEDCPIRFEFEHGAIDAQMSVNGGVLLVVTGHIVYLSPDDEEESEEETVASQRRKAFVHTFFLGSTSAGGKRSYYIHNDVLRFLHDDEERTVVASNTTATVDSTTVRLPATVEEPPAEVIPAETTNGLPESIPGGGVEESKEIYEEPALIPGAEPEPPTGLPMVDGISNQGGGVEETKEALYVEELEKGSDGGKAVAPPKPGSWASLVATGKGSGTVSSAPSTPARSVKTTSAAPTPKQSPAVTTPAPQPEPTTQTGGKPEAGRIRTAKRDPDCTLVIKNFDMGTTEEVILGLFESFIGQTDAKVVGCTVSAHRTVAFIDFDSPKPVLAAVEKHKKEPMQLGGRVLEIYQKTVEQQARRSQGGRSGYRGGQPGNGRHQYRRSGSGGGGRGHRGGGGRGGRGGR